VDREKLEQWFRTQLDRFDDAETEYLSRHLDEIDCSLVDGLNDISNALAVLSTGFQIARARRVDIVIRLRIELGWTSKIDMRLPELNALPVAQSSSESQPEIYLIRPQLLGVPDRRESYRCSYLDTPWGDGYLAEYECFRLLGREWGTAEFGKNVWVQVAP
jgi:hypothetical protein